MIWGGEVDSRRNAELGAPAYRGNMEPVASESETLRDFNIGAPGQVIGDEGDVARLEANLRLSPSQRLARATKAANFVLNSRRAMTAARNGQL